MARNLYGLFWFFVFLAIVNSTIGNADAGVRPSEYRRTSHSGNISAMRTLALT